MPYNERDFLNGLAAGLTATASASIYDNAAALFRFQIHLEDARMVYVPSVSAVGFDMVIDWGDGTIEQKAAYNSNPSDVYKFPHGSVMVPTIYAGGHRHEYKNSGDYVIEIRVIATGSYYMLLIGQAFFNFSGSVRRIYDYLHWISHVNSYVETARVCAISPAGNARNPSQYVFLGVLDTSILRSAYFKSNLRLGIGQMFRECLGLASITFNARDISLEANCFYNCPALKDIYYSGTKEQWSAITASLSLPNYITVHCNSTGPNNAHDG